ncbi:MAG: GNAT family N-acetyltransferase [Woeseiaceae bacterium]|nr:GNAT family N-acetyltransferase [Woeseiaceae bacterium]
MALSTTITELETRRLRLQWLDAGDADLLLAIWNDPAFVRYVGDRGIRTKEQALLAFEEGPATLYRDYGFGPFRVSLRDGGDAIGICGLFRRTGLEDVDIGYALLPQFCGRGYAEEAARAVVGHAKDDLGLRRLTAIISPDNKRSIGLVEKLGLRFEKMIRMPDDDEDVCLYGVSWQ